MPERLDCVYIDVLGDIVEITRRERDILLVELAFVEGAGSIRERLEVAETSRPVELDAEQRLRLRRGLRDRGSDHLQPEGISRLHEALARSEPPL
jgi:hypothetical protein